MFFVARLNIFAIEPENIGKRKAHGWLKSPQRSGAAMAEDFAFYHLLAITI